MSEWRILRCFGYMGQRKQLSYHWIRQYNFVSYLLNRMKQLLHFTIKLHEQYQYMLEAGRRVVRMMKLRAHQQIRKMPKVLVTFHRVNIRERKLVKLRRTYGATLDVTNLGTHYRWVTKMAEGTMNPNDLS